MFRPLFSTTKNISFSTIGSTVSALSNGNYLYQASPTVRLYGRSINDNKPLKVIIGTSDFKDLRFSDNYVDKSGFIEAVDKSGNKICINTFPRRFLKSANLDLLKTFYEIEVDKNGNPLPEEERKNKPLFVGGSVTIDGTSRFLEPLKVATYPDLMSKQGKIPVITADFKNVSGNSYNKISTKLKVAIHKSFLSHGYLTKSNKLKSSDIALLEEFIDFMRVEEISEYKLESSLEFLSRLLSIHFNTQAMILVDEYDTGINAAFQNPNINNDDLQNIVSLHRSILGQAFKSNPYLKQGLVTGILRIAKANIFSGFNNPGEFNICDKEFAGYYGFTQEEVDDLVARYNVPSELSTKLKDWYNGYEVPGNEIYNPWSISKALAKFQVWREEKDLKTLYKEVLKNYWQESGGFNFISPLFKHDSVKENFMALSNNETVKFDLIEQISVQDFIALKEMLNQPSNYEITPYGKDVLFSYLFASGYLTTNGKDDHYRAPNKEAMDTFVKKLLEYYKVTYKINILLFNDLTDKFQLLFDAKNDNDYSEATSGINQSLENLLSAPHKFSKIDKKQIEPAIEEDIINENESLIQDILSMALLRINASTQFGSEVYLGNGRVDCLSINDKVKKAIIFEVKYEGKDGIKSSASAAIKQIEDREYKKPIPAGYEVISIGLKVNHDKTVETKYKITSTNIESNANEITNIEDVLFDNQDSAESGLIADNAEIVGDKNIEDAH